MQWKWISFLQPLLALALLAPLAAWARRWPKRSTLPALVLLIMGTANVRACERLRHDVDEGVNWVSPDLGFLGDSPALDDVDELNVDLAPFWETMWAVVALEPRRVYLRETSSTPNRPTEGQKWTLVRRMHIPADAADDVRTVNESYALVRASVLPPGPLWPEGS